MKEFPIYLLRHGQTIWNAEGRFQGQMNSDLTDIGRAQAGDQAQLLADVFALHPEAEVLASPLGRVRETHEIALAPYQRHPVEDDRLKEIHSGLWEGVTRAKIESGWPEIFAKCESVIELFMEAPEGEGHAGLHQRCQSFIEDLQGPSVVFSHGTTIAVLRGILLGLTYRDVMRLDHLQGCIYKIQSGQEEILKL